MWLWNKQLAAVAVLGGLILSLSSLFNITDHNFIGRTIEVDGASVSCDSDGVGEKTDCTADYSRGWPVGFGEGGVVLTTDGRVNEKFEINVLKFLYNTALISSLLYVSTGYFLKKRQT